jgi:hypothetical protein
MITITSKNVKENDDSNKQHQVKKKVYLKINATLHSILKNEISI